MQIVLSILQAVGVALLLALVAFVFVALLVLFSPLSYILDIHWVDDKYMKFKAGWLLNMIRAKVSYQDDLIYGEYFIFFKKHNFSYDLSATDEKKVEHAVQESDTKKSKKESIISKIKGMIERIKEIYPKLKKIFTDESNKEAVAHLKKELVYLIQILLPQKSKVDAAFSTGSPDTTGQLFGVLALVPAMYQESWRLIPDFESEELYFKGEFFGKGRLYGYQIIGIILRIVFDKKCRRLYTIINKFKMWMKRNEKSEERIDG